MPTIGLLEVAGGDGTQRREYPVPSAQQVLRGAELLCLGFRELAPDPTLPHPRLTSDVIM